jgi:hypothetical protein
MATVLGIDAETLTAEWHEATRRTYAPFFETTRRADAFGRALITSEGTGGDINLAPAISPDGRRMVFLSERSLFSIDMYLADVATGEVVRRIVETASDPHFDSLQFLSSAGDWAPDNRRFVFAALSRGQPVLAILDADSGRREAQHEFPDLGEIYNPAWSPDGRHIAFSALTGGVLDLYVFDLESETLRQLTDDPFADMDPEWSPDGASLAWVTDRFTSDLDTLAFGDYRIGLMDVRTGAVRPVAGFNEGRHTNPEFSADGGSLYFIGTPDGIPNIYRVDMNAGRVNRVTNVLSGVSGITPLTPALSVASAAPGALFTVFEEDRYNVYSAETPEQLAGEALPPFERNAAVLPLFPRPTGEVALALATPAAGLPPPSAEHTTLDYSPRLSLDAISQPTVGVGVDRFGAYAAGGIALLWSDMLGNHTLGTTIQATSRFSEFGGAVYYLNRESRWNWGFIGEQTPYVTGTFARGIATIDGRQAFVEQTRRLTQINRGVTGVVHYPFSTAQRVEFSGGARRISFDDDIETRFFSTITGGLIEETIEELPRPDALTLGEASTALVYDTSLFGATAPILGQRYRLEYTQTTGSLMFSGVLADYRRYFMPARPFTIALRGLHYGRYGRDGEDTRLSPMYVGYPGLVRGYELGSFDASECQVGGLTSCPVFDQLVGSRLAVVGAELRFPIFGLFDRSTLYGPLPVDLAFFGDAGTAWTSDQEASFLGGDRDWVRSVGVGLRFNAFGYAVMELDYVRPLDRPDRGWLWQFNLTPGF